MSRDAIQESGRLYRAIQIHHKLTMDCFQLIITPWIILHLLQQFPFSTF